MRIVTIGGTSFTGRVFNVTARNAGHAVTDFSRPHYDLNTNLAEAVAEHVAMDRTHTVVNFAALNMVGESWEHAADYYRTNVSGVAALVDGLLDTDIQCFVQVSTPEVFGASATGMPLTADHPHEPSTPYALSRSAAEKHLELVMMKDGFPVKITRTVNVYGVGQQLYRLIPKVAIYATNGWRFPLHGGGTSSRSFLHVADVARGILTVAEHGEVGRAYHMAGAELRTIREVAEHVCRLCGRDPREVLEDVTERPGKDPAYLLHDDETRALGWDDGVPFEDAVRHVAAWAVAIAPTVTKDATTYQHRG